MEEWCFYLKFLENLLIFKQIHEEDTEKTSRKKLIYETLYTCQKFSFSPLKKNQEKGEGEIKKKKKTKTTKHNFLTC